MEKRDESFPVVPVLVAVTVLGGGALYFTQCRTPVAPMAATASAVPPPARKSKKPREPARSPEEQRAKNADLRRERDALRDRILANLKSRGGSPPPEPDAPGKKAPPAPPGEYSRDYIQTTFREDMFPLIRACYESALKRKPELRGKLVMSFGIVGDPEVGGVVEDAEFTEASDLKDAEMETCVRESLMTLTFDRQMEKGGYLSVTYPVLFSPEDEDAGTPDAGAE
jgi:hypothetical protein